MSYLDEAAELLRQARDGNEARADLARALAAARSADAEVVQREVDDRRIEIAAAFIRLAAIEHGLAPAFEVPEPREAGR
jgi:hypothetical protein